MFWRWLGGFQRPAARDGFPAWIKYILPRNSKRNKKPSKEVFPLFLDKFQEIIAKKYFVTNVDNPTITSSSHFFIRNVDYLGVSKSDDIQIVYHGTSCAFSNAMWAPKCWLPTTQPASQIINYKYCMMDKDLDKMFLNFPLLQDFHAYSGVDFLSLQD